MPPVALRVERVGVCKQTTCVFTVLLVGYSRNLQYVYAMGQLNAICRSHVVIPWILFFRRAQLALIELQCLRLCPDARFLVLKYPFTCCAAVHTTLLLCHAHCQSSVGLGSPLLATYVFSMSSLRCSIRYSSVVSRHSTRNASRPCAAAQILCGAVVGYTCVELVR